MQAEECLMKDLADEMGWTYHDVKKTYKELILTHSQELGLSSEEVEKMVAGTD